VSILDDIYRGQQERCNARINRTPCNWVFDPGNADRIKTSVDANGREMILIHQPGVICFSPGAGPAFPESNQGKQHWYVPYKVCRKCQHYRKGGTDRLRYPHCQWTRERCGGNAGAARETLGMMNAAVERANEIIGG